MKLNYKILIFALSVLGVATLYNNCSRVEFSQLPEDSSSLIGTGIDPENPPPRDEPPVVEEVVKNCADLMASGQLSKTPFQKIVFEDTEADRRKVCEFGKNGNLASRNDFIQARYEQTQKVNLPAGAILCTFELKTDATEFIYDDMFYLTYNDYIIATSLKTSLTRTSKDVIEFGEDKTPVSLYKYDWTRIAGAQFNNNDINRDPTAFNYCLGADLGAGECMWPNTQQQGRIDFGWDPELLINIGLKADSQNQRFGFIVTGDNDPGTDCYHPKMEFEVQAGYYIP